jgi:hypothetical protein
MVHHKKLERTLTCTLITQAVIATIPCTHCPLCSTIARCDLHPLLCIGQCSCRSTCCWLVLLNSTFTASSMPIARCDQSEWSSHNIRISLNRFTSLASTTPGIPRWALPEVVGGGS